MPKRKKSCYTKRLQGGRQRNRERRAGRFCLICDKGLKDIQIYEEINPFFLKDMLGTPTDIIECLGENVYKEVWLCSKCKSLVEDARTIHNDEGTMMTDDEGVSQLHNNFRVLREQISEMMRKSWKDSIAKETAKNLTNTVRTILVRSLFEEEDMDVKPDLNLLEGGSQGQPKVRKKRTRIVYQKRKRAKKTPKKVLNYIATNSEEGEGQTYTCSICPYATLDLKIMKTHQKQHQGRDGRLCLICDKGGNDVQIYEGINTFLIKDVLGTPSDIIESLGENVYMEVWLCSTCKLLVEDARTVYNDEGTMGDGMMIVDEEGVSELYNNFRLLREQSTIMMRKSWMDAKERKNLTYTIRTILVRSLFEEEIQDVEVKPDVSLLDAALGGDAGLLQDLPKPKKNRFECKKKIVKEAKKVNRPPKENEVLNYVANNTEEEDEDGCTTYTCTTCSFVTPDQKTMDIHQTEHHHVRKKNVGGGEGEERLPCPQCLRTYKTYSSLAIHISFHNKKNNQDGEKVCPHCGLTFQCYGFLSRHIRLKHNNSSEKCEDEKAQKHPCPHCEKTFKASSTLKYHIRHTHDNSQDHLCPQCGKIFKTPAILKYHIRHIHNNKQESLCPQCRRTFKSPSLLKNHIRQIHNNNQEHLCPKCGRTFRHHNSLSTHRCGEGPGPEEDRHTCSSCEQKFTTVIARRIHERSVHEGLPVYKCPEPGCTRVFPILSKLQFHRTTTHRDVRPFVCERCGSGFKTTTSLMLHGGSRCRGDNPELTEKIRDIMRRQKKWRKCDQCDFKTFGVMQQLNKHVKNMHKKKDNVQSEGVE